MRATFFRASPAEAAGVHSSDALPDEPVGDPVEVEGPAAIRALASALGHAPDRALRQVVDTTCRSFPVWSLASPLCAAIAAADDDAIDEMAEAWRAKAGAQALDADLHELTTLLGALHEALLEASDDERIYLLLEETAG